MSRTASRQNWPLPFYPQTVSEGSGQSFQRFRWLYRTGRVDIALSTKECKRRPHDTVNYTTRMPSHMSKHGCHMTCIASPSAELHTQQIKQLVAQHSKNQRRTLTSVCIRGTHHANSVPINHRSARRNLWRTWRCHQRMHWSSWNHTSTETTGVQEIATDYWSPESTQVTGS